MDIDSIIGLLVIAGVIWVSVVIGIIAGKRSFSTGMNGNIIVCDKETFAKAEKAMKEEQT